MKIALLSLLLVLFGCGNIEQPTSHYDVEMDENEDMPNGGNDGNGGYERPDDPLPPPASPSELTGVPILENGIRTGIQLRWRDNSSDEIGFILQWFTSMTMDNDFGEIFLDANSTSFDTRNTTISAETHYFAILAYNSYGCSEAVRVVVP